MSVPRALFVLVTMLVIAVGCSGDDGPEIEGAPPGGGSVVVLLPDSASTSRWERDDRRFLSAAFDRAGIEYSIVNAEGDARQMLTQAEQAIDKGAEVLLMVNLDSTSGNTIIENARAAGVKVIDYDRLTVEGEGADYYVSFDGEEVGRLMGRGLVDAVEDAGLINPGVAVLNGPETDNNATLFASGYDEVIDPLFSSGEWTKIDEQSVPGWDGQQARQIFDQIVIASEINVNAVLAANDTIAGAVIASIDERAVAQIPVTGQDASLESIQAILAGKQSMTVYKAFKDQAEAAAELAIALVEEEPSANMVTARTDNGTNRIPSVLLTPVAVTADNIAETVIADGFRTWDEICVGEIEPLCPPEGER